MKGLEGFKEKFFTISEDIISKFNYPAFYEVFWKRIQEKNKDFVTIDEINNRPHKENVIAALKVFHNMGMLLYFSEIIPSKVFCKPQILLNLLYEQVLSKKKKDRLSLDEISRATEKNTLDLKIDEIIKLLLYFDLVFEVKEEKNTFFIPQYLNPIDPYIIEFQDKIFKNCNVKIIGDNYLMSLAMLKIYSRYGNYVSKEDNRYRFWQNGIIVKKDDSLVMIKYISEKQQIEIYPEKDSDSLNLQKEIVDYILDLPENENLPKRNFENHKTKRWRDVLNFDDEDYSPHFSERIQEYDGYLEEFESRDYKKNIGGIQIFSLCL
ncbi:hypothetical protein FIA58_005600 [Flavobacterium jejuense]|uniref:COR domain-containing protein n=1 Tax=Flavobacterium jejuense TaxID=1544455 RepID=A0ABX0IPZ7_9FLAO|nr:COR domain-containing protein [Flavobacterium jejuense]NHN25150.1 hypothetical protein [Flavobacterium jejuense]